MSDQPPPLAEPPVFDVPPPLPPAPPAHSGSDFGPRLIALVLSVCFGLFLADAVVSLVDDSLILFFGVDVLTTWRVLLSFLSVIAILGVYFLMGLTPAIPKRVFLPLTLFNPLAMLALAPFAIYYYGRLPFFGWIISLGQALLALVWLRGLQGGVKIRWPLVPVSRLGTRWFSWSNLALFALFNALVLLPAVMVYLALNAALAVHHFSDGFLALRPAGLTVQVRKYVRPDGKTIQLIPMSHIAEADFYRQVSRTFATNTVILQEGVKDEHHLLTNKIDYRRMANTLGLAEQQKEFAPGRGRSVWADVDVQEFHPHTIELLNLAIRLHADGASPEVLLKLAQYSPAPHWERQVIEDLLGARNRRVVEVLRAQLPEADHLAVPWGAAHMPGIAREIQKAGFRLDQTQDYVVMRFRRGAPPTSRRGP